jgi:uncharacterized membrane protein
VLGANRTLTRRIMYACTGLYAFHTRKPSIHVWGAALLAYADDIFYARERIMFCQIQACAFRVGLSVHFNHTNYHRSLTFFSPALPCALQATRQPPREATRQPLREATRRSRRATHRSRATRRRHLHTETAPATRRSKVWCGFSAATKLQTRANPFHAPECQSASWLVGWRE